MAEYFDTRDEALDAMRRWHARDGTTPAFFAKILDGGREKWMVDFRKKNYGGAVTIVSDLTQTLEDVLRHPDAQSARPSEDDRLERLARDADEKRLVGATIPAAWRDDLLAALRCENVVARRCAASALQGFRDNDVFTALKDSLSDNDGEVRCAASRSLWLVHGESVRHLLEAIATGDPDNSVRNEVRRIMRELRPQRPPVAETAGGDSVSVGSGKPEPASQTQCGLCAVWIASGETMPLDVLQRAVAKGFNPFSRPELDMSRVTKVMTALGHSNHETWQMWASEVSSEKPGTPRQDKFCPPCFKAVTEAADRGANESPLGKAPSSVPSDATIGNAKPQWWRFWK